MMAESFSHAPESERPMHRGFREVVYLPHEVPQELAMKSPIRSEERLFKKIRSLPPERIAEVEDFVDFLRQRTTGRSLVRAAMTLSESSFSRVWDNPDDADYDRL